MAQTGFEPTIAASKRRYTHALDSAATRIGNFLLSLGIKTFFSTSPDRLWDPPSPQLNCYRVEEGLSMGKEEAKHSPSSSAEVPHLASWGTTLRSVTKQQCGWTSPGPDMVAKRKISLSRETETHHTGFMPWNGPDCLL